MSRRGFLAAGCAAACAGATGLLLPEKYARAAEQAKKLKIRVIYALHAEKQAQPDWPNKGFDFVPVMDTIDKTLAEHVPEMTFVRSLATGEEQAKKILADDTTAADIDGYIVYQLNCWNRVVQTVVTSGKPVLYCDFQFGGSGGFLVYTAGFLRSATPNLGFVASSNLEDVVASVKCFGTVKSPNEFAAVTAKVRQERTPGFENVPDTPDPVETLSPADCMEKLKECKILAVRDQESGPADAFAGVPVERVSFAELNAAWEAADKNAAKAIVDKWYKGAAKIVGVPDNVLMDSAAMYLAEKAVMEKHNANAITINCLGGFYGNHIHAYPCLGFHELNNEGLIGACECDVASTASMVLFTALTKGRPGYISDPVLDSSMRRITYAHCVASNRPFGPKGDINHFEILTHSEDRQGASVRSILPVGYLTTTIQLSNDRKEMLFHQGKVIANDPDDRACRTKLAAEPVGDFEKMFTQWDKWSWHRVTCYGDLKKPVFDLADAMGYKVIEEA
jgi:hypothetical protein